MNLGWEIKNELASFFLVEWREREGKKCQDCTSWSWSCSWVDHEDDVNSLLFVVVLSGASVGSYSPPPSDTCCGACDSEVIKKKHNVKTFLTYVTK